MTKSFKLSSLLAVMLLALSANMQAAEELFGPVNRKGCCPQTGPICNLNVQNNAWVGGTLNARCVNVECCGQPCPAMVGCEKCLLDTRGTVTIFFEQEGLPPFVLPARGDTCFTVTNIQQLVIQELKTVPNPVSSGKLTFDIVFSKPFQTVPSILLSSEFMFFPPLDQLGFPVPPFIPNQAFTSILYNPINVTETGFTVCLFFVACATPTELSSAINSILNQTEPGFISFLAQGSINCP